MWGSTAVATEAPQVDDIINELGYYSLYEVAEGVRWKMSDIPWDEVDM